jgi:hypothetical protein
MIQSVCLLVGITFLISLFYFIFSVLHSRHCLLKISREMKQLIARLVNISLLFKDILHCFSGKGDLYSIISTFYSPVHQCQVPINTNLTVPIIC